MSYWIKFLFLQIKQKKIQKLDKLKLINEELKLLEKILNNFSKDNLNLKKYLDKLITVNLKLWKIEDDIRECERNKKFDQKFIDLARSVYLSNDDRAKIKLEINEKFGSTIIEVKSYERY